MSAEENAKAPEPQQRSKMMPIFLVLNTLLLAGVLVFLLRRSAAAPATAAAADPGAAAHLEEPLPGPIVKLENFIIQLKSVDAERYVRVAFDLQVATDADKNVVTARLSPIRDSVIAYFADRTLDELRGSGGMEQTKATLLRRLGEVVPGHRIQAIYITDFVVQ